MGSLIFAPPFKSNLSHEHEVQIILLQIHCWHDKRNRLQLFGILDVTCKIWQVRHLTQHSPT